MLRSALYLLSRPRYLTLRIRMALRTDAKARKARKTYMRLQHVDANVAAAVRREQMYLHSLQFQGIKPAFVSEADEHGPSLDGRTVVHKDQPGIELTIDDDLSEEDVAALFQHKYGDRILGDVVENRRLETLVPIDDTPPEDISDAFEGIRNL